MNRAGYRTRYEGPHNVPPRLLDHQTSFEDAPSFHSSHIERELDRSQIGDRTECVGRSPLPCPTWPMRWKILSVASTAIVSWDIPKPNWKQTFRRRSRQSPTPQSTRGVSTIAIALQPCLPQPPSCQWRFLQTHSCPSQVRAPQSTD